MRRAISTGGTGLFIGIVLRGFVRARFNRFAGHRLGAASALRIEGRARSVEDAGEGRFDVVLMNNHGMQWLKNAFDA